MLYTVYSIDYVLIMCLFLYVLSVFGHISYRSDWELVKVDFRQSFPRQCTESDYDTWQLSDLQVTHKHTGVHARNYFL